MAGWGAAGLGWQPTLPQSIAMGALVLTAALVVFTFIGYPALMGALARLRPARPGDGDTPDATPDVCVVMAVYNEGDRAVRRVENLLATDYPADRLRICVVSDGSTDGTVASLQALGDPRITVVEQPERRGKAEALNRALAEVTAPLVVFCDARQRFEPGTIPALVAAFADPRVGAASGRLLIDTAGNAVGGGVDAYWKLESFLRRAEAQVDSCIGCTGAVYAIRRELYRPLPPDTILDDVVVPMQIAVQGYRVDYRQDAVAYDPQSSEPAREKVRKRRTLAGNFQMLFRYPAWLLPWRNRLWWQLAAHKYLRLLAPWLLIATLGLNVAVATLYPGAALLAVQLLFYALAVAGMLLPSLRWRLLSLPAGFVFLNLMTLRGLYDYLTGRASATWQTVR